MIEIKKTDVAYYARRMSNALFELENMQISYQAQADLQYHIVEKYKDENGKRFEKAQKAAAYHDEYLRRVGEIEKKKQVIINAMADVWHVYTGDRAVGVTIADWLRLRGNMAELEKHHSKEVIQKAMEVWSHYVDTTIELSLARYRERKQKLHMEAEAYFPKPKKQ